MDPELIHLFDVVVPMTPTRDSTDEQWGVGVSLSGGGFRATLLGIGALLAIVDAGQAGEVRSIASVSGGSLANAFVWSRMDFRAADPTAFSELTREAIDLVSRGLVTPTRAASARLVALVLTATTVVVASCAIGSRVVASQRWGIGIACALVLAGLVRLRGHLLQANLQQVWFKRGRGQLGVDAAPADPEWWSPEVDLQAVKADRTEPTLHLVATTDLAAAEPVYFTQEALIARGLTHSLKPTSAAAAVRLSMSLPFVLPASRRRISKMTWTSFTRDPDHMLLCDGGVFNNLGTDWDNRLRHSVGAADYAVMHPKARGVASSSSPPRVTCRRTPGSFSMSPSFQRRGPKPRSLLRCSLDSAHSPMARRRSSTTPH
jgi:hypothetical protein